MDQDYETFNWRKYIIENPILLTKKINDKDNAWEHYSNQLKREKNINRELFLDKKILLYCHIGDIDVFKKMEHYVQNFIDVNITCHIVLNIIDKMTRSDINYILDKYNKDNMEIVLSPDFGFDIGGFLSYINECITKDIKYDYVIKIHTKTSDKDRYDIIEPNNGSINRINYIIDLFNKNDKIGLIGGKQWMHYNNYDIFNIEHLTYLIEKFSMNISARQVVQFAGGTMFYIRFDILKNILLRRSFNEIRMEMNDMYSFDWNWYIFANKHLFNDLNNINDSKDAETHFIVHRKTHNISANLFHATKYNTLSIKHRDGMIEHAYERLFSYMVECLGYEQIFLPITPLNEEFKFKL